MLSRRLLPVAVASALVLTACDTSTDDAFTIGAYVGTYRGTIVAAIDSGSGTTTETGTGTAVLARTGDGTLTLRVASDDPEDADGAQLFTGTYEPSGAMVFSVEGQTAFTVSPDGALSGRVRASEQGSTVQIDFSGNLKPGRLVLRQVVAFASPLVSFTGNAVFDGAKSR